MVPARSPFAAIDVVSRRRTTASHVAATITTAQVSRKISRYEVRIGRPDPRNRLLQRVTRSKSLHYIIRVFGQAKVTRLMQEAILEFWFGRRDTAEYGNTRNAWFRKDAAFDAAIRERFGSAIETALSGGFADWTSARGVLARILVLDQFTRNAFRDTPRAFSGDALALPLADEAIARGEDEKLIPVERRFMYLPFVHTESPSAQQRGVELFRRLRDQSGLADPLLWAERHADVIRLFGRFPHRNAILGRESTPEETAFLAAPGSRF
jgi:uncharacterized protein (DUF924 family)